MFEIEVLQLLLEKIYLSWWHMSVVPKETGNDTGEHDWLVRLRKRERREGGAEEIRNGKKRKDQS